MSYFLYTNIQEVLVNSFPYNKEVLLFVENKIDDFISHKLTESMPMLGMFLNDELKTKIKTILLKEIEQVIPEVMNSYASKMKEEVNVQEMVYQKVVNFSSDKLEEILVSIMKKEFKFIELLGGVLGFIIGTIQTIIILFG